MTTWLTSEHRTPSQICDAWHPADIAAKAVLDGDPDGFVADAALFAAVSLMRAGVPRQAAVRARAELHAAAGNQLAALRAAGAGRAGSA